MNLALGIFFLFTSACAFYIASRGLEATSPYGAFKALMEKMRGESLATA